VVVLALVMWAATGCTTQAGSTAATNTKTTVPLPAGAHPSSISVMVCSRRTAKEINTVVGEKATVDEVVWVDHRYSCRYGYPTGSMAVSVKELSSWSETLAYFDSLATALGVSQKIPGLGQGAFQATDGSMVVRKDWKVLVVDTTGLPAQFGVPATSSGNVALRVTYLIIGCWAGD
jgi:hypothetical protein